MWDTEFFPAWQTVPGFLYLLPGGMDVAVYRDSTEVPYGKVGVNQDGEPGLSGSLTEVDILAVHPAGRVLEVRAGGESLVVVLIRPRPCT